MLRVTLDTYVPSRGCRAINNFEHVKILTTSELRNVITLVPCILSNTCDNTTSQSYAPVCKRQEIVLRKRRQGSGTGTAGRHSLFDLFLLWVPVTVQIKL